MQEKSENFNSLRPILYELCKKNYRGGVKLTPPSRNRVKTMVFFNCGFSTKVIYKFLTRNNEGTKL